MQRFRSGEGFALATINLDHVVKLTHDPCYREVYAAQDLVVADGNPIVWLSKIAGLPVDLLPGSDLLIPMAKLAAGAGIPVAMVGTTDKVLNAAGDRLQEIIPDLQIVAKISPPFGFDPRGAEATAVFDRIRASGAGMVFIALGAPKQETFAAMGRAALPGVGFASFGAALDFISGYYLRAPLWVRKLTLEWLWRVLNEPRRLIGRYTRCVLVLPRQVLAALRLRWSGPLRSPSPKVTHAVVSGRASEVSGGRSHSDS